MMLSKINPVNVSFKRCVAYAPCCSMVSERNKDAKDIERQIAKCIKESDDVSAELKRVDAKIKEVDAMISDIVNAIFDKNYKKPDKKLKFSPWTESGELLARKMNLEIKLNEISRRKLELMNSLYQNS